jgi:hypothetical protein
MVAAQLEGWLRHVPRSRVLVIDGETLETETGLQNGIDQMSAFLEMPASNNEHAISPATPTVPVLSAEIEAMLEKVLGPQRTALALALQFDAKASSTEIV